MQPDVVTCRAAAVRGAGKVTSAPAAAHRASSAAISVRAANRLTKGLSVRGEQITLQADGEAVI